MDMNPPWVYMSSQSWTPLPPPIPYHLSGSSPCTSPKHPVFCIKHRLAIHFTCDNSHVLMPFSQIIPPLLSPTESKRLFYTSVSLLLSRIQGYCYHLSKFHIYALVYCIGGQEGLPGMLLFMGLQRVGHDWATELTDWLILYWCFSFWLTSLCIIDSSFIHLIRTDSNVFFLMAE